MDLTWVQDSQVLAGCISMHILTQRQNGTDENLFFFSAAEQVASKYTLQNTAFEMQYMHSTRSCTYYNNNQTK